VMQTRAAKPCPRHGLGFHSRRARQGSRPRREAQPHAQPLEHGQLSPLKSGGPRRRRGEGTLASSSSRLGAATGWDVAHFLRTPTFFDGRHGVTTAMIVQQPAAQSASVSATPVVPAGICRIGTRPSARSRLLTFCSRPKGLPGKAWSESGRCSRPSSRRGSRPPQVW